MDAPPLIERYAGALATVLVALLGVVSAWVGRISGRVDAVEDRTTDNAADIRHMQGDLTEVKETIRMNHRETMRGLERVYDKIEQRRLPE